MSSVRQGWTHHCGSAESNSPRVQNWDQDDPEIFREKRHIFRPFGCLIPCCPSSAARGKREHRVEAANLDIVSFLLFFKSLQEFNKGHQGLRSKPGLPTDVPDKILRRGACFPSRLSLFWKGPFCKWVWLVFLEHFALLLLVLLGFLWSWTWDHICP